MISLLLTIAALATPHADKVNAHYAGYPHEHGRENVRYFSLDHIRKEKLHDWHAASMYTISSASRDQVISNHLPIVLDGTATYYSNLANLGWAPGDLLKVLENYPYSADKNPLIVRLDWLAYQILDTRDSDAYLRLFFGGNRIPKTDKEFFAAFGVNEKEQANTAIGWVEVNSQVNLHGTRLASRYVTNSDLSRGLSAWITRDSFFVKNVNDPLETLDDSFLHQGRELIVQVPKSRYKGGEIYFGAAQIYLLAQGNANRANERLPDAEVGKVVGEAPPDLVRDFNDCLGAGAIVNNVSCVVCHNAGMKFPTRNGLLSRLRMGVELRVYDKQKRDHVEAFHLTEPAIMIQQDNRLFARFVEGVTGLSTVDLSAAVKRVTDDYRADLEMADAARELFCTPDDLKLAIGYASANHIALGHYLAALAHGESIPRKQWEDDYLRAKAMVDVWRAGNPTPALMAHAAQQQAPDKLRFTLIVTCPAEAVVYLGKRKCDQTGTRREFVAEVKPDWSAKVTVTAVLGEQREAKEIECKAGETVEIAMNFEASGVKS